MDQSNQNSDSGWKRLKKILRRELSPEWIGFNGVHAKRFATPQIHIPYQPYSWIIYRIIIALYFQVWLGVAIWRWGEKPDYQRDFDGYKWKMFIYLSGWAFAGVCLYFFFSAIGTLVHHVKNSFKDTSHTVQQEQQDITRATECTGKDPCKNLILPWYFKITWFLQNVFFPGIILTTFLRWAVATGEAFQFRTGPGDIHAHGIAMLMALVDIILIRSPYRLQHAVYPMLVGFIYIIFLGVYYLAGGTNEHHTDAEIDGDTYIYRGKIDWGRYPKTTAFFCFIVDVCGAFILHLSVYLLFKIKEVCVQWYYYCKHRK